MLLVQPYCSYLTSVGDRWRGVDYASRFYTLMLKGEQEKLAAMKSTYQTLPLGVNGAPERVEKNAVGQARIRQHFGRWAARTIRGWGYDAPMIIPIPNSHVTINVTQYPTLQIATGIAQAFGEGAQVNSAIRFREAMPKSHKGGTRNQDTLEANMAVRPNFSAQQIVLVDDMTTSGSHLKAARRALQGAGMDVTHAVVGGRRTEAQVPNPFALDPEDLDEIWGFQELLGL